MARSQPEKKQPGSAERRILPVQLQIGDRLTHETGEYEVIGRPYSTNAGKDDGPHPERPRAGEATSEEGNR